MTTVFELLVGGCNQVQHPEKFSLRMLSSSVNCAGIASFWQLQSYIIKGIGLFFFENTSKRLLRGCVVVFKT